jgi:hypothetical protein
MTRPVPRTAAVSAAACTASTPAGRGRDLGAHCADASLRRLSCRYWLTARVTAAAANAATPVVSVRNCGMFGQYGLASPPVKLATKAEPDQISTAV